jgi:hypothetical protein
MHNLKENKNDLQRFHNPKSLNTYISIYLFCYHYFFLYKFFWALHALSLLCARRVTRWEHSHLQLGCDSEMVLFTCTKYEEFSSI